MRQLAAIAELLVIAEARHVDAGASVTLDDHLALARLHRHAVDLDVDDVIALMWRHPDCGGVRPRSRPRALDDAAAAVLDHVFELVAEMLQEALHRPRGGVAERADRVAFDLVRDVDQHVEVFAAPLPCEDARAACGTASRCLHGTACTGRRTRRSRSARAARSTRTMQVVSSMTIDGAGASAEPACLQRVVVHVGVIWSRPARPGTDEPPGITALNLRPPRTPPASSQQVRERNAQRHLEVAGLRRRGRTRRRSPCRRILRRRASANHCRALAQDRRAPRR